jgi:predicted phosphohydrolase
MESICRVLLMTMDVENRIIIMTHYPPRMQELQQRRNTNSFRRYPLVLSQVLLSVGKFGEDY